MNSKVNFSKATIDHICEQSKDYYEAFFGFYRHAIPEFNTVKKVNGFPVISDATAQYCIAKLHELTDDAWNVNGLWLNNGFSSDSSIPDWTISNEKILLTV